MATRMTEKLPGDAAHILNPNGRVDAQSSNYFIAMSQKRCLLSYLDIKPKEKWI